MAINTQIPQKDWQDFFVTFSNGNHGRMLSLEVLDAGAGASGSATQGKLMAIDYDPVGKGNDIVVTTGSDAMDYSHTINGPVEVWKAQHNNGEIAALEIIDQNNVKTVLSLGA
jgi:hypothetical protein